MNAIAKPLIIDADAHFYEPTEVWSDYLPRKFQSDIPQVVMDNQGRVRMYVGGVMMPYIPPPPSYAKRTPMDKKKGAFDPAARLADMDREGINIMAIYPTKGLYFYSVQNVELCLALCEAYNNWAKDFIAHAPNRMLAPALVPQMDVALAIEETKRAAKMGLRGVFLRPNSIGGRTLDHPAFSRLWSVMEDLNMPLVLHEGTTQDVPQAGNDRYDNFLFRHMISHPFEQQMGLLSLICGGVLERHPKLRAMIVEAGVGWAPYWIDRMDDHMEHWGHASATLKEKPSDYFRRQVFVSAEGAERLLPFTIAAIGDDNICFSTDYPHPDHPFEGCVDGIRTMEGLSETSKRKILGENAARLFGLDATAP